jgi:putative endonuclease
LDGTSDCFWTYVLENTKGRFYIGHTDDLQRRLAEHNDPTREKTKFTTKDGPWSLVWSEPYPARSAAMLREREIKSMKSARWIRERLLGGQSESRRTGINR